MTLSKINILMLVGTACLLSSCSSSKEVSYQSGNSTQTFTEGSAAVPKDFPLPIYPKAQATGSVSSDAQQSSENTRFLMLSTTDPVQSVSKYYREELKTGGWKIEQVDSIGTEEVNISAAKKGFEAGISVSADGKKTFINLQVSKELPPNVQPNYGGPFHQDDSQNKATPATD